MEFNNIPVKFRARFAAQIRLRSSPHCEKGKAYKDLVLNQMV
jgi:hypothetical protein